MVSLTAVENYVAKVWPGRAHAAVQIPDSKKGERIVLVTNHREADRKALITYAKQNGLSELSVPKDILTLDKIPVLGSGKTDYVALREWVLKESPDNG
jgi:acyl-[acyl-carrier-protein]-phospholipid O-acyltransferase/long-chain-fatty-acid--[acyl-carrier-protein] ligase